MRIYIDGVPEGTSQARSTGARDRATSFDAGGKSSNPAYDHDGPMDEVRVADLARSGAWTLVAFRNQSDPTAFLTVGAEQTPDAFFRLAPIVIAIGSPRFSTMRSPMGANAEDDEDRPRSTAELMRDGRHARCLV